MNNRFILVCLTLSGIALIVTILSWLTKPSTPTVQLSAKDWMCVESAPNGLQAECTMYTRAVKHAGAKQ